MGVYYNYCNLDRLEHFSIGLGKQAIKQRAIGRNRGARALGLLLLPEGRWFGQRVCVLGDDHSVPPRLITDRAPAADSVFAWLTAHFRDVRVAAIHALLKHDATEMRELLETDAATRTEVVFFADHGDQVCQSFLAGVFGSDWRSARGNVDYTGVTGEILARGLPLPEDDARR